MMKIKISTEASTRAKSQRAALTRTKEPQIQVGIGLLQAVPPPLRLTELITTNISPTPATPSPNAPQPPNQDQGQTRPRSRHPSHHPPAFREAQIVSPSTVERGQGFFDLEDELPIREGEGFPGRIGGGDGGGFSVGQIGGGSFPMAGLSGTGKGREG